HRHPAQPGPGQPAQRCVPHRGRVQLAGYRVVLGAGRAKLRLPADRERHPAHRRHLRLREPDRRPALCSARPAHPVQLRACTPMSFVDQPSVPHEPQGPQQVEPILPLPTGPGRSVAVRPDEQELAAPATGRVAGERMLRLARRPYTLAMLILLAIVIAIAIFGPLLAPYNPLKIDVVNETQPPSPAHLFGTDDIGHDIFSRVLVGTRYSLEVAVVIPSLAISIGVAVG